MKDLAYLNNEWRMYKETFRYSSILLDSVKIKIMIEIVTSTITSIKYLVFVTLIVIYQPNK